MREGKHFRGKSNLISANKAMIPNPSPFPKRTDETFMPMYKRNY